MRWWSMAVIIPWCALVANPGVVQATALPRVAIWGPDQAAKGGVVQSNPGVLMAAETALKGKSIAVTRLDETSLCDAARFSGSAFDVLMIEGNVIPFACQSAMKNFADGGGVIVALNAPAPFFLSVAKDEKGVWQFNPPKPDYAWERRDFMGFLGIHFDYPQGESDLAVEHTPTRLLQKYLPDAASIHGVLPTRWVRPEGKAEFYPLLRSHRTDLHDAPLSLYLVKNDKRFTIISTSDALTANTNPKIWQHSAETVVALASLALDLREGKVQFSPDMRAEVLSDDTVQLPLQSRFVRGSVEPENAKPLIRWGKFDGSCVEFGPALESGIHKTVAGAENSEFPRALKAGAVLTLTLPSNLHRSERPTFLRIRGAFNITGAGLKASWGTTVVDNEIFNYIAGPDAGRYSGLPVEFTRIIFLPPVASPTQTLTIENPGQEPIYFDAVQVEQRAQPAPDMVIAMNSGGRVASLPKELVQTWGRCVTASART